MANLGTLDMASRYGLGKNAADTFNQYLAKEIVANGSDAEKFAYLLGGALGNYYGRQRNKKDNKKIDTIVNGYDTQPSVIGSDENGVYIASNNAENSTMPKYTVGESIGIGSVPENVTAEQNALAQQQAQTDAAIKAIAARGGGDSGFNKDYTWDNVKKAAKEQGISSTVLDSREADIKKDIAEKAKAIYMPQIQNAMFGSYETQQDGSKVFKPATTESMLQGLQMLNEYEKYDPEGVKAYKSGLMNTMLTDRTATRTFENNKALKEMEIKALNEREARREAGLNARHNSTIANNITKAEIKNALTPASYLKSMGYKSAEDLQKAIDRIVQIDEVTGKYKPISAEQNEQLATLNNIRKRYNELAQGGRDGNAPQGPSRPTAPTEKNTPDPASVPKVDNSKSTKEELNDEIESSIGAILTGDGSNADKMKSIQSYLVNEVGLNGMDDPDAFHKEMKTYLKKLGYGTQYIRDTLKSIPSLDNIEDFPDQHPNLSYYDERNKRNARKQQKQ